MGTALVGMISRTNVTEPVTGATRNTVTVASRPALGSSPPAYVTRDNVRAMVASCETTRDRLLLQTLWESGGRVSEVLALRSCDIDRDQAALSLTNLKQRGKRRSTKLIYVSRELVGSLAAFARDLRLPHDGYLWRTRVSGSMPMHRREVHRIVTGASTRAGVLVIGRNGARPATGLDFRHGAAVHLLRAGHPITEVQQHLGHARIDTTTIYLRLTDPERRRLADRIDW